MWGWELHVWENASLYALAGAGLFAGLVAVATYGVVMGTRAESAENKRKLAEAQVTAAEAGRAAASANERAAELEVVAAKARLETERLKVQFAWRTLTSDGRRALAVGLKGVALKVALIVNSDDPERLEFAEQLATALNDLGILDGFSAGGSGPATGVRGVQVQTRDLRLGQALVHALKQAGVDAELGPVPSIWLGGDNVMLLVGSRLRPRV